MGRREENNQGINPEDADNYSFYENEKIIEIIEINKEPKGETIEKTNHKKKTRMKMLKDYIVVDCFSVI